MEVTSTELDSNARVMEQAISAARKLHAEHRRRIQRLAERTVISLHIGEVCRIESVLSTQN